MDGIGKGSKSLGQQNRQAIEEIAAKPEGAPSLPPDKAAECVDIGLQRKGNKYGAE
jgi:hypothetical protein